MRLLKSLLDHISDAVLVTNLDAVIQYVNPAFCALTGYSAKEIFGKKPSCLKSGRHGPAFYQAMWQSITATGGWQGQIWNRRKNGEAYLSWLKVLTLRDTQGKPLNYIGLARATLPGEAGHSRYQAAAYDPLTGLPNAFLFADRLALARAQARRHHLGFAVLDLELGGFSAVRELLGPPAGDRLLQEVAERLRHRVREIDTVARLQSEHFALIISEVKDLIDLAQLARTIVRWLEMPFSIGEHTVSVQPALGIALYPDDHTEGPELLRQAGEATQRARAVNKGHFCFYQPQEHSANGPP